MSFSLRDRLKKLTAERDSLESQLKNEKDERDLYKVKKCFTWKADYFFFFFVPAEGVFLSAFLLDQFCLTVSPYV